MTKTKRNTVSKLAGINFNYQRHSNATSKRKVCSQKRTIEKLHSSLISLVLYFFPLDSIWEPGRWCLIQLDAKHLLLSVTTVENLKEAMRMNTNENVLAIKCHKRQVRCKAETEKAFKSSTDKFTLIKIN